MDKKLNLLISFLAVSTGFIFYYTWHSDPDTTKHISENIQESNISNNLADKVSIPKKETNQAFSSEKKIHPIKVHLTKDDKDKNFIEDTNISSVSINQQKKHIAQVYSKLEPDTYQEDIQEAEENFDELDVESQKIKDKLNNEVKGIE